MSECRRLSIAARWRSSPTGSRSDTFQAAVQEGSGNTTKLRVSNNRSYEAKNGKSFSSAGTENRTETGSLGLNV